ncbi:MAG: PhoPQ-activated protein PqaA family protein, partial [Pirellulales bacterium]
IVTVSATGTPDVADGTTVILDVDLNNDGDFGDAGELGHTQSTMYGGKSDITITPALERTSELYTVGLRARVKNADAVSGTSAVLPLVVDTQTSDALANYVNAPDTSYRYSQSSSTAGSGYTYYVLDMTSQTWRSTADVNLPVWRHWVGVYVPTATIKNTAMLFIDGGSNTSGPPAADSTLGAIAAGLQSVFVVLKTIPNEPVIFTDETRTRSEDAIIAYTFDKFMTHLGEPGNETWPLLLPMVKSAVRAMDTIQDFIPDVKPGAAIDDFLVTGYSKRGWTTWLTAAVDDRVRAIIPGVFDNLNQGPQMVHHYGVYGFFSEAVGDYEEMQIFERLLTPESQQLSPITDPYRYLNNGKFDDMPKLIMVSSGDEFFVTDSAQFYIHDLPGDKNYLRYVPNTGHGLELTTVVESTVTFTDAVLNNRTLPTYSWTVAPDGSIHVQTPSAVSEVKLWQATNPTSRDFRRPATPGINWTATTLVDQGGGNYVGDVPMPAPGATGYFVELSFPNPVLGFPNFLFTTEVRVKSSFDFEPWPFGTGEGGGPVVPSAADIALGSQEFPTAWALAAPVVTDDASRTAAAVALSIESGASAPPAENAAPGIHAAVIDALLIAEIDEPASDLLEGTTPGGGESE